MIARQVREDRGGKLNAIDPLQRQGVRRHLHHAGAAPAVDHPAHEGLHLRRLGRRPRGVEGAIADAIRHGPHQAAANSGRFEDRAAQIAGRRLAVGAGDADDASSRGSDDRRTPLTSRASARRASLTTIHGTLTSAGAGASETMADAPAAIACGANAAPSAFSPASATNTEPGSDTSRVVRHARALHVERRTAAGQSASAPPGHTRRARAADRQRSWLAALRNLIGIQPSELEHDDGRRSMGSPAGGYCCVTTTPVPLQPRGHAELRQHVAARRARSGRARSGNDVIAPCAIHRVPRCRRLAGWTDAGCSGVSSLAARDEQRLRRIDRRRHAVMPQRGLRNLLEDRRGDRRRRTARPCAANRPRRRS